MCESFRSPQTGRFTGLTPWRNPNGRHRKSNRWIVDHHTGCWVWQLSTNTKGYGRAWDTAQYRLRLVHVMNYEQKYGPVLKGLELDHFKCHNKLCVNPDHVEPVTHQENILRYHRKEKLCLPNQKHSVS